MWFGTGLVLPSDMQTQLRLSNEMSAADAVVALAEGNPGAVRVCVKMLEEVHYAALLAMDLVGLYGSAIWVCFNDECGGDVERFNVALTAKVAAL